METRDWREVFRVVLSKHSTGVPYVRAACPNIDIICSDITASATHTTITNTTTTGTVTVTATDTAIDTPAAASQPLTLSFAQNVNDDVGGVIWDCGLLLVDCFLAILTHTTPLGAVDSSNISGEGIGDWRVLDLGTGTGVAGIVACINGAKHTTLTDYKSYDVMVDNLSRHSHYLSNHSCTFVEYSWYVEMCYG